MKDVLEAAKITMPREEAAPQEPVTGAAERLAACPDCRHTHAGAALGGICVGCPCPTRPAPPEPPAVTVVQYRQPLDGRELIRAVRRALEDDPDLTTCWPGWARRDFAERVARHLDDAVDRDEALRRYLALPYGPCEDCPY